MKTKDWLLVGIEATAWCGFIYYVLYITNNPVNPFVAALILPVLGYIAVLSRLLRF